MDRRWRSDETAASQGDIFGFWDHKPPSVCACEDFNPQPSLSLKRNPFATIQAACTSPSKCTDVRSSQRVRPSSSPSLGIACTAASPLHRGCPDNPNQHRQPCRHAGARNGQGCERTSPRTKPTRITHTHRDTQTRTHSFAPPEWKQARHGRTDGRTNGPASLTRSTFHVCIVLAV